MKQEKLTVAIVGGETLLGREMREVIQQSGLPFRVQMVGSEESTLITGDEAEGEAEVIRGLEQESLTEAAITVLAGSAESSSKALEVLEQAQAVPVCIDLTDALEERAGARLRCPALEPKHMAMPAGTIHVIPHAAAIVVAQFLDALHSEFPVVRSVANILTSVSEYGRPGVEELQKQVVALLSFNQTPKDLFDTQSAFAVLAGFGEESKLSLEAVENRVERHLASLLMMSAQAPMPSFHIAQAPVFHGLSISVWVEFEDRPSITELQATLAAEGADVRGDDLEAPNNVGMAGQSGYAVGSIREDRNNSRACWFWLAADNLRVSAEAGLRVMRQIAETRA